DRTPISMRPWPKPDRRQASSLVSPDDMAGSGLCVGCGACAQRMEWNKSGFLVPAPGSPPGASFAQHCPFSPKAPNEDAIAGELFAAAPFADARIGRFEAAYVGHASEQPFRPNGSSGGLTS